MPRRENPDDSAAGSPSYPQSTPEWSATFAQAMRNLERSTREWRTVSGVNSADLSQYVDTPSLTEDVYLPEDEEDDVPLRSRNFGVGWEALNTLPAGFSVVEPPGEYFSQGAYVALRERHVTYEDTNRPGTSVAPYADRIRSLVAWANEAGFSIGGIHNARPTVHGRRISVHNGWIVARSPEAITDQGYTIFVIPEPARCPSCSGMHPAYTFVCPQTGAPLCCPNCGTSNANVTLFSGSVNAGNARWFCGSCCATCEVAGCQASIPPVWTMCENHASHGACHNCSMDAQWVEGSDTFIRDSHGHSYCTSCARYFCRACSRFGEVVQYSAHHEMEVCPSCVRNVLRSSFEVFDEEDTSVSAIRTIPGRENIRMCGVEIEGGNGTLSGRELAQDFYSLGISRARDWCQHHAGTGYGFAHVEPDSSVDWEAVIGPVNMADPTDVLNLNRAVTAIRTRVRRNELTLDLRCGLHIHVAASQVALEKAYNLSHIFTYLEDPIFRLSAAKWPMHRAVQGGRRYCVPIPKHGKKLEFFNLQGGARGSENRYFALSFQNYFQAMTRMCGCGAVAAGLWEECTCELGKCTFEFRLFNTTANPRKLYAYIALCQALVAKAVDSPEIRNPDRDFPGLPFTGKLLKDMDDPYARNLIDGWRPRLRYMFTQLPLTDDEKAALYYCVRNSEIVQGIPEHELHDLVATPEEVVA